MSNPATNRRGFMTCLAAAAATPVVSGTVWAATSAQPPKTDPAAKSARLFKAVKWGMIEHGESVRERFEVCQELGFDGMELISPADFSIQQARQASQATGMPIHGLVDMKHWDLRLSSPDASVREQGRAILEQAIRDAKAFGGDSVLLVPGRVTGADETHDHVWQRSIKQIRRVLPLASRLGVRVLIENVWNGFCESPEQLRDYIDEIDSPWVGSYYDIGNSQRFSPTEKWIRVLGKRIVKLDVKDWGVSNGFGKIGDGDVNWPAVREALGEIGFTGWCTAEVAGGNRERLAEIAQRMDRVLEL